MAISDEHEAFARDIVAVAKKHGMSGLTLSFRAGYELTSGGHSWGEVTMNWTEQGHSQKDQFHLKAEQHANFEVHE